MAGELPTAVRNFLEGPTIDASAFRRSAVLTCLAETLSADVSSRITNWGTCKAELANWHPRRRSDFRYPELTITATNADGLFSPGHASEVWGGHRPQSWRYDFELSVVVDGTEHPLASLAFPIADVRLDGRLAEITAVHPLAALWSRRWIDGDPDGDRTTYGPFTYGS